MSALACPALACPGRRGARRRRGGSANDSGLATSVCVRAGTARIRRRARARKSARAQSASALRVRFCGPSSQPARNRAISHRNRAILHRDIAISYRSRSRSEIARSRSEMADFRPSNARVPTHTPRPSARHDSDNAAAAARRRRPVRRRLGGEEREGAGAVWADGGDAGGDAD